MASVAKRKWTHNGVERETWVVRYKDTDGAQRQKKFDRKKDADAYKQQVEREMHEGVHVAATASGTFDELALRYIADCERRHRVGDRMCGASMSQVEMMHRKHLVPYFKGKIAADIAAADVRALVNLKAETFSRNMVQKLVSMLKCTLQFGVQEGVLRRNVVKDQPPRNPVAHAERTEVPSIADLQRLMQVVNEPREYGRLDTTPAIWKVMVYLGALAGFRKGEMCGLQWENVDFEKGVIKVRHSFSLYDGLKGPKSKAGIRDIPMAPQLADALHVIQDETKRREGYVLLTRSGKPFKPHSLWICYWKPLAARANLRKKDGTLMTMHALRHAAVSLWIKAGLAPLAVKGIIGHASIGITMDIYGHLFPEDDATRRAVIASAAGITKRSAPTIDGNVIEPQCARI